MNKKEVLKNYNISEATLRNWKKLGYIKDNDKITIKEIEKIIRKKDNTRRNKKNSNEHIIPESYLGNNKAINYVKNILILKDKYKITNNEILIEAIIQKLKNKKIPEEIKKILGNGSSNVNFIREFQKLKISYNKKDDILGLLYMSLLSVGKKDTQGIFYTPHKVVHDMVKKLKIEENQKILDPGCGSGNFLIEIYKKLKSKKIPDKDIVSSLYGYDIDEIAVLIAKINIYCLDEEIKYEDINIFNKNFLENNKDEYFDIIIGNPPWGIKYKKDEKEKLKKLYGEFFSRQDSFTQFILKSFEALKNDGTLYFVLPSSLLNIKVHEHIRKFLLDYNINCIENIGRQFNEITTEVILLKVSKNRNKEKCLYNNEKINQNIFLKNPSFNFLLPSKIPQNIIKKVKKFKHFHLNDKNSNFSLGIVTGNNKKMILNKKVKNAEPIISGKDLTKYNFNYANINQYIVFEKEKFQQVAKIENYRLPKIIYKFISKKLCFSVEENGLLTLNSANIINIKKENIYYISAILNSRITELFFDEIYNTHKVLKNHIQSFYIFKFNNNDIEKIIKLSKEHVGNEYDENIENIIYTNLKLTKEEIEYLRKKY